MKTSAIFNLLQPFTLLTLLLPIIIRRKQLVVGYWEITHKCSTISLVFSLFSKNIYLGFSNKSPFIVTNIECAYQWTFSFENDNLGSCYSCERDLWSELTMNNAVENWRKRGIKSQNKIHWQTCRIKPEAPSASRRIANLRYWSEFNTLHKTNGPSLKFSMFCDRNLLTEWREKDQVNWFSCLTKTSTPTFQ